MTAFIYAEIPLWDDLVLHVDGNSKVTASNGTFANPKPNAFSLPHISSCPGSTPTCRKACYVHGLEKHARDVSDLYRLNAMALSRLLMSEHKARAAAEILGRWIETNCVEFRWHVSGDLMHDRHAKWIVDVCREAPNVQFWIYTRTFSMVPWLVMSPNLVVNLSADVDNYSRAVSCHQSRPNRTRICYLTIDGTVPNDLPDGSVIFPDYSLRGRELVEPNSSPWWRGLNQLQRRQTCPADFFGQSESARCGPCNKCMVQP